MSPLPSQERAEQVRYLPQQGVVRVHYDPAALPRLGDAAGTNRFDDPRPRTEHRYLVRYTATTLRGCLLELLDALRIDGEAAEREAAVTDDADTDADATDTQDGAAEDGAAVLAARPWQAIEDYLAGRHVGMIHGPGLQLVSVDDPVLQASLDREPGVRALLDSPEGRQVLLPAGAGRGRRAHLDGAAVRLSSELGRDLTRACSLALRDRAHPPAGIHYRSRHDDAEDCWALYDHASVTAGDVVPLSSTDSVHRDALHHIAALWDLPLPPNWRPQQHS